MKHEKGHGPGHDGHEHTEVGGIRFEETDINYRPIMLAAIYMTVSIFVFTAVAWGTFQYLRSREASTSLPANPLAAAHARKQPPEPRLQADPRADLLALRAAEDAALGKLGWVNRRNGLVQIPIERAMEIAVERGFPVRQAAPAAAAPSLPRANAAQPGGAATSLSPATDRPADSGRSPSLPPAQHGVGGSSGTSSPRLDDAHDAVSPEEPGN